MVNIVATFQSPYSGIGCDLKIAKETNDHPAWRLAMSPKRARSMFRGCVK
jgi:hypothetical protein